MAKSYDVTSKPQPIILVRGFGGLTTEDERKNAYQGFNEGSVYPKKRGENYIYEGLILRFLKSNWGYQDSTNVVNYCNYIVKENASAQDIPELKGLDPSFFKDDKVIIDPFMAANLIRNVKDPNCTLWVFRYYDLEDRDFPVYGKALVRLIGFIRALARLKTGADTKVNIIAHSMGGLIVREAVQVTYPEGQAEKEINKIVTLGTPHQGISFQIFKNWINIDAEDDLEHFNPNFQADKENQASYLNFKECFPLERLLTVVGTNYRTYGNKPASWANRWFGVEGEGGPNYNRSDGLVKQAMAQIPGAPRTFVFKCHGGEDSLVTSREAFEIITRFFFGNIRARLRLLSAEILRGKDWIGKSEFFFGVSIKPRRVDFDLFHQSRDAENCYGPFTEMDLSDPNPAFGWAGENRLIWEGWLNTRSIEKDPDLAVKDMVMRLDFYVSERDTYGVGFSDNKVFVKQYYVRATLPVDGQALNLTLHENEDFTAAGQKMKHHNGGWAFTIGDNSFKATLGIELDRIPDYGPPIPLVGAGKAKAHA